MHSGVNSIATGTRIRSLLSLCILALLWYSSMPSSEAFHLQGLSYDELLNMSYALHGKYALTSSAKILYNLPEAHGALRMGHRKAMSCSPVVIRVSDISSLFDDLDRPQVLISGAVHGNERVGPIASIYTAKLLVWAAECEIRGVNDSCKTLMDLSISRRQRVWLTHLATQRDTYILPGTSCACVICLTLVLIRLLLHLFLSTSSG